MFLLLYLVVKEIVGKFVKVEGKRVIVFINVILNALERFNKESYNFKMRIKMLYVCF